ncbi:hypothetical protein J4218_02470 [Candidatus Pacearchaeota archaeon]|nr:hypothetical protein [Candidatus Pacearchaeota archaeon]
MANEGETKEVNQNITEIRVWSLKNFLTSVFAFLIIIVIFLMITIVLNLNLLFLTMVACFFIVVYSIMLFFLLEPRVVREVNTTARTTVEKPVIKEVFVDKPVQVVHEVEKKIYIMNENKDKLKEKKKLIIPKYNFIGSSQALTYHKRSCRMSKLIKKKYKILDNDEAYFIKRNFKPCEICILKTKKV